MKRVLTVIGNRPQFIKAAAVSGPLRAVADEVLVHTGQHYDEVLSQVFFDELELPRPEHHLDLG
ncbi:MAG: UDP-N-acetylglucosamine 2-epimerase (non-hydrolyzing), partial [Solirubrobacteraceae bacterium]